MWAEERLIRTVSTVSTRLVQLTCLERQKLSVGVERFARSLGACVSTDGEWRVGARQSSGSTQMLCLVRRWRILVRTQPIVLGTS